MKQQDCLPKGPGRHEERRRFPRYPWKIPVDVKTSHQRVLQGELLNVSQGGVMMETDGILYEDDLLTLEIGPGGGLEVVGIVLHGQTVWERRGPEGLKHYGVAFVGADDQFCEGLKRFREIVHAKAVAETLGLMFVDLTPSMVESEALSCIKKDLASSLHCMPIKLRGEKLMVAMTRPDDPVTLKKLHLFSTCQIFPVVATPSAIKNTQIECGERGGTPSERERFERPSMGENYRKGKPRIVALASSTPSPDMKYLASNLGAVLNRDGSRVFIVDFQSGDSAFSDAVEAASAESGKLVFLTLPGGTDASSIDWALRVDEAVLVVSPSHWEEGCSYLEAALDRFVKIHNQQGSPSWEASAERHAMDFSVVCVQIQNLQQGFKTFDRIEKRVHDELDMKNPRIDIRLSYLGGILDDERFFRKTEEAPIPVPKLSPGSRASQCLTHIAQSLLKPTLERDPRVRFQEGLAARIFVSLKGTENFLVKISKSRALLVLLLGLLFVFVLSHVDKDFGSIVSRISSGWFQGEIQPVRLKQPHEKAKGIGFETARDKSSLTQPSQVESLKSQKVFVKSEALSEPKERQTWMVATPNKWPGGASPTLVRQSAIALAVQNREPKGLRDRISLGHGRVYCWVHVMNGKGRTIIMRWVTNGKRLWDVHLPVGSDSWRTWAYITLRPGMVGPGRVEILNEDGQLLKTEYFEIESVEQKEERDAPLEIDRTGKEEPVSLERAEKPESLVKGTDLIRALVDVSSIPDQTYYVMVNAGPTHRSQAVLLDVPADGTEVFFRYTSHTKRLGVDSPRKYIEEFDKRIGSYKAVRIANQNGTTKGYLLVPTLTNYRIRSLGSRIEVSIKSTSSYSGGR